MVLRFADCVFDPRARTLSRRGAAVHLTPKAFGVLHLLVADRPRAVPKAELLERVWPGTFVTDASLARTIHEIREAIGDADGAIVRTVHGHGYAFGGEVVEDAPALPATKHDPRDSEVRGWLHMDSRGIALRDGDTLIGRDPTAALSLDSSLVSWHHARLRVTATAVTVEDLTSKNGTTLRGQRIVGPTNVHDGDDIVVGTSRMVYRAGARLGRTETAR